ncbi:ATPase [Priestia taiwanensis]|uniref:PurM-like N-terminal domain-containing protein n=1 Tax=Priestia taiwanensis TaxID=1347902 RepID=A0A917AJJ7_9BACI|nr:ATPase [Priestia taiwanensis]MBM7361596.1 hypothetical protein [Priestia taiwanensis]GGE55389.1 hypothetical protein GCM10007140_02190 [Priestia taiwanensis]
MRDVSYIPWGDEDYLVIAVDNAGGIGEKEQDVVHVPYETVAYYTTRVAMMECMAVGARPTAIIMQNLTSDEAYSAFEKGIRNICKEMKQEDVYISGSSESNIPVVQTCLGITVIGNVKKKERKVACTPRDAKFAVIGVPLVGEEVVLQQEKVLPLSLFKEVLKGNGVYEVVPVGSKGVRYEVEQLLQANDVAYTNIQSDINITASSGPATCVVISYHNEYEQAIHVMCGEHFHPLTVE